MHPGTSGWIFVGLLILNLAGALCGISVEFIALEPALLAGSIYAVVSASIYPLYVRHQHRNLHRYSDDMRIRVTDSFGAHPWKTHAVLIPVMAVFAFWAFVSSGAALFNRLVGAHEERPFTVIESEWVEGNRKYGRANCYDTKLEEFPKLSQVPRNLCFNRQVPKGARLLIGGYHSWLGTWVHTVRGE